MATFVIAGSLIVILSVILFVVYPWCTKGESLDLWNYSQIKVEVWYFDETSGSWKFWQEVYMRDWLKENGRYLSEIDREATDKYLFVNWIAWKDDTSLPLPAAFVDAKKLEMMNSIDLTGPYGFEPLDSRFVR